MVFSEFSSAFRGPRNFNYLHNILELICNVSFYVNRILYTTSKVDIRFDMCSLTFIFPSTRFSKTTMVVSLIIWVDSDYFCPNKFFGLMRNILVWIFSYTYHITYLHNALGRPVPNCSFKLWWGKRFYMWRLLEELE